jgi:hypothetical protein
VGIPDLTCDDTGHKSDRFVCWSDSVQAPGRGYVTDVAAILRLAPPLALGRLLSMNADKRTRCPEWGCPYEPASRKALHEHVALVHRPRGLRCPVDGCAKRVARQCDLNRHLRRMHPTLPVACSQCDERFASADALVAHALAQHAASAGFPCSECPVCCRTADDLERHADAHAREALRLELRTAIRAACEDPALAGAPAVGLCSGTCKGAVADEGTSLGALLACARSDGVARCRRRFHAECEGYTRAVLPSVAECRACRGRRGLAASALEYAGREPVLLSVLLKARGLKPVPVVGDGLCFFRALAHVLFVAAASQPAPEDLYKQAMAQLAKDRALWQEHYATQPQQLAAIDRAIARALQPGAPVDLSQLWDAAATDLAIQFACKTDAVAARQIYAAHTDDGATLLFQNVWDGSSSAQVPSKKALLVCRTGKGIACEHYDAVERL